MSSPFLVGLLTSWCVALVAIGGFLYLAYTLVRREVEYLLFGAFAVGAALTTAGLALGYSAESIGGWRDAMRATHVCGAITVVIHTHFVLRFTRTRLDRGSLAALYLFGVGLAAGAALGWGGAPGSEKLHETVVFGHRVVHLALTPAPTVVALYVFAGLAATVYSVRLLAAYRAGMREAMALLVGNAVLLVAGVNDALLGAGWLVDAVYLTPHAFVLYAFAVASTLLFRYHRAAGELEQTATSLRERTAELRNSYIELSEMEDELVKQQQLAAVGELAASIAHEVRNPLAVIVNAVASLRREHVSDRDRQTLLDIVDEETSRLNGLVTDLLRFARPFSITSADVDLPELLERAARIVGDEHQVDVDVPDDPLLSRAAVDPALLRLALENVIENACQAMPEGGTISISSEYSSLDGVPCVRISVRDRGAGMNSETKRRALDPFFTTRRSGTGLGLPIAARIMEAHRGTLTIESEPRKGTVIGLLVPAPDASDHAKPPSRRLRLRPRAG